MAVLFYAWDGRYASESASLFFTQGLHKYSIVFVWEMNCYGEGYRINEDILIVLSPQERSEHLCTMLKDRGFSITLAQDVQTAFDELKMHIRTFLIIDFELPNAASFLMKVINTFYDPPPYIIALGLFSCSMEQADMLNLGTDTCLEKPVDLEEILAVINAVLRRADRLAHPKPFRASAPIERGALQIDQRQRSVTIDNKPVLLTKKEFDVLVLLANHRGTVFSKAQIYERVWNEDYNFATTSVSDVISSLRKKLGLNSKEGRYIQTVRGIGYRFVDSD